MKDYEGRKRQFVIREKKEESYDAPSVRRRNRINDESIPEETPEPPRAPRQRKSLREREMEEEAENRRSFRGGRRRDAEEDYDEPEDEGYDEEPVSKAPKVVRFFAWMALLAILFAGGYLATNFYFNWSDKKGGERIGSVYGSGSEVKSAETAAQSANASSSSIKYTIYVPEGDAFKSREIDIIRGNTREEDIKKVMSMYIDSLKETKLLDPSVNVKGIYQSGDILFLDMPKSFLSSLKGIGKDKAAQVLNGIQKTAAENFAPITRIKFYADSKEIQEKTPLDLSKPWGGSK